MKYAVWLVVSIILVLLVGGVAIHAVEGTARLVIGSIVPLVVGVAVGSGYTHGKHHKAISAEARRKELTS